VFKDSKHLLRIFCIFFKVFVKKYLASIHCNSTTTIPLKMQTQFA